MPTANTPVSSSVIGIRNGSGAAAILAAGIGACALAILAIATDRLPLLQRWMDFYHPTGPLSGVTTTAVVVWLITWGILEVRWRNSDVNMRWIGAAALLLLVAALLLTFPPLADAL